MTKKAKGIRTRVRERAQRSVRQWVFGVESNFPGDPRRQLIAPETAWTPMRLVQFFPEDGVPVQVGSYSGIHHTVTMFHGGVHHVDWVSCVNTNRVDDDTWFLSPNAVYSNGPIVIGSDVWITFESLIMSGVTIGHGAVVAARAVVTRDVQPYEIVGGNPAKHIAWRFDEETRAALLRIAWWDWPPEKVKALRHEIDSPDVQGFIERHDPARQ